MKDAVHAYIASYDYDELTENFSDVVAHLMDAVSKEVPELETDVGELEKQVTALAVYLIENFFTDMGDQAGYGDDD